MSEEERKEKMHPVEAQEINVAYTAAYSLWFILDDARFRLNKSNMELDKKRRRHFAKLKVYIDKAKEAADELYKDYYKCWGSNIEKLDQEQACANSLARLMLLWQDRVGGYEGREKALFDLFSSMPMECIGEKELSRFFMKTLEVVDRETESLIK